MFTLHDAYKPFSPNEYVVKDLISTPSITISYGAPGSFKTFLFQDLAVNVAGGFDWLTPDKDGYGTPWTTTQSTVIWIDYDMGRRRLDERFAALSNFRNLQANAQLYYYSSPDPILDCSNSSSIEALKRRVENLNAKLICVDNLAVVKSIDENNSSMSQVMRNLRWLVEKTSAALILIHHQNKSNSYDRVGDRLRGHSSIEAGCDLALHCTRETDKQIVKIRATKSRDAEVEKFAAIFQYDHQVGTKILSEACFKSVLHDSSLSKKEIEAKIVTIVQENHGINQTQLKKQIAANMRIGDQKIRGLLKELEEKKKVDVDTGPNHSKIYSVGKKKQRTGKS